MRIFVSYANYEGWICRERRAQREAERKSQGELERGRAAECIVDALFIFILRYLVNKNNDYLLLSYELFNH